MDDELITCQYIVLEHTLHIHYNACYTSSTILYSLLNRLNVLHRQFNLICLLITIMLLKTNTYSFYFELV